jgi:hypothetical protein
LSSFSSVYRALGILVVSALMLSTAANAAAVVTGESPVHVKTCNPQQGAVTYPGFVGGYYPVGRYYWPDVYGYNYYQPPIQNNPSLAIDYVNVTSKPIKEIEFGLLARGNLVAEVRDVGTFSPNAEIKHQFGLNPNVFPLGTGLPRCVPLHVHFEDGTSWKNPHLPALRRSLYE